MSYLTEVPTNLDYENYAADSYHLPNPSKGIDLIGDEFKPKQNGHELKDLDNHHHHHHDMQTINVTGATAQTTNLGPNMVLVNAPNPAGTSTAVPTSLQVQQIIQQAQQQQQQQLQQQQLATPGGNLVSVAIAPTQQNQQVAFTAAGQPTFTFSPHPPANVVSSSPAGASTLVSVIQQPQASTHIVDGANGGQHALGTATTSGGATVQLATATGLPINSIPVDLPSATGTGQGVNPGNPGEESGVLLCNLDELSRYIPENFYSDFSISEQGKVPDYLETVVAGKGITTTVSASQLQSNAIPAGQTVIQPQNVLPVGSMTASSLISSPVVTTVAGTTTQPQQLTIQLPTQPQPIQGVKTVTYVNPVINKQGQLQTSPAGTSGGAANLQPVKLTTPTFAYTSNGKRFQIQGLPEATNDQLQLQVKHGAQPQTLQLQGLTVDPPKVTVLQELPEVGKLVVQEARPQNDSIATILEEMKCSGEDGTFGNNGGIEYATAIPVAVSSVSSDPKKTTIKRVAAPASTVILPNNRSRNIILAGNTGLPQGAIPIKINGLNALQFPAVKSLPQINLSNLTPCTNAVLTSPPIQTQVVSAKKTKVEVKANLPQTPLPPNLITKVVTNATNNNVQQQKLMSPDLEHNTAGLSHNRSISNNNNSPMTSKTVGNNKTCNWVFENGEVCGKTFSKSYNLVVHMRMHEDVRPFCCSLCDQTFRQKAHLQRHETTHGIGVKVGRGGSSSSSKRKRKRSRSNTGTVQQTTVVLPTAPLPLPDHLQKRLAHVSEKFGNPTATTVVTSAEGIPAIVSEGGVTKLVETNGDISDDESLKVMQGTVVKSYSKKKMVGAGDDLDSIDDEDKMMEGTEPELINSSYVEVSDEVANLKEEDMIEQAEDLTPETDDNGGQQKTILSVLLASNNPTEAINTIQTDKMTQDIVTTDVTATTTSVKVVSQPEISSAPNTISPEMITAISGGKVTPDASLVAQAVSQELLDSASTEMETEEQEQDAS